MKKTAGNLYKTVDENELLTIDNLTTSGVVVQGSLEMSNVNGVKEMVSLIESQRRYEQMQRAMQGIDELDKKSIEQIGSVKA